MIQQGEYEALRDFMIVANSLGIPFILIGAGARLMILDWENKVLDMRSTEDWDFGVQLQDWSSFRLLREKLIGTGLFHECGIPHRLRHASSTMVDFVPFGEIERPDGEISWEGEDAAMNVVGYKEAIQNAIHKKLDEELAVPVVSVPGFIILKIFAFNDRSGDKKEKDLQDIFYVFNVYHQGDNANRAFDDLMRYWDQNIVKWDTAGAFLMGKDVAEILRPETYEQMLPILDSLCDEDSLSLNPLVRIRGVTEEEELAKRKLVCAVFRAFRISLEDHYTVRRQ